MIGEVLAKEQSTLLGDQFAFGWINNLGQAFSLLINPGFQVAAVAVIVYFVYGAFKYITSAGDKEAVAVSGKMITHSIIGFILLIVMFLIVQFIPEFFGLSGYKIIE